MAHLMSHNNYNKIKKMSIGYPFTMKLFNAIKHAPIKVYYSGKFVTVMHAVVGHVTLSVVAVAVIVVVVVVVAHVVVAVAVAVAVAISLLIRVREVFSTQPAWLNLNFGKSFDNKLDNTLHYSVMICVIGQLQS